jgi:hypothetical protein
VPFTDGGFAPREASANVKLNVVVVLSAMQGAEAQAK